MRIILEMLRIILLLAILGAAASYLLSSLYEQMGIAEESYTLFGSLAILLLFFVLYRNKLQFSGWYKGKGREKLPKAVSYSLCILSILFLSIPPVLHLVNFL